jgi:hypothetical protein
MGVEIFNEILRVNLYGTLVTTEQESVACEYMYLFIDVLESSHSSRQTVSYIFVPNFGCCTFSLRTLSRLLPILGSKTQAWIWGDILFTVVVSSSYVADCSRSEQVDGLFNHIEVPPIDSDAFRILNGVLQSMKTVSVERT